MKNKNLPKRQKPKMRNRRGKKTYFNPWICRYFDLSGNGLEDKKGGKRDERFNNSIQKS